ncbi:MAG TPA: HPF/RaiA family ribosome-associated protein [Nitrospiria bacterium]
MNVPVQITVRNMPASKAVEDNIHERFERLEALCSRATSCRVTIESPPRHSHKGGRFSIRIDLKLPKREVVVKKVSNPDIFVAIRDAFNALRRQLEDFRRKQRGEIKTHEETPHGKVVRILEDYGFLETEDGREIYFHRNSVLNGGFEKISVGSEVRYSEEMGEEGPQASTVVPVGSGRIREEAESGQPVPPS